MIKTWRYAGFNFISPCTIRNSFIGACSVYRSPTKRIGAPHAAKATGLMPSDRIHSSRSAMEWNVILNVMVFMPTPGCEVSAAWLQS